MALFLAAELVERVDAALQAPHILEAGVGSGNDFRHHGEHRVRQVQTTVAARHGDAPKASLACGIEVLVGLACIVHSAVNEMRAFEVDILRVGFNDIGSHVAGNVEDALVVLNSIFIVDRSVVELLRVFVVSFLEFYEPFHQRMVQMEPYLRMISIIISHVLVYLYLFLSVEILGFEPLAG